MADARDGGFELLPIDDPEVPAEDALNAAMADALGDDTGLAAVETAGPEPFGSTWAFDWEQGRYKRHGGRPVRVTGLAALREWCMMAVNSTRFAHVVFTDRFGIDDPLEGIGTGLGEDDDLPADYEEKIRNALLIHDRIVDVTDFDIEWNPVEGVLYIHYFRVVTDEADELPFSDIQLREEAF